MADKVTNLYNAFIKNGYAMESESQFRENLKDPKKRKAAYDALVSDGYNMEPYADFESNIGYAPKPQVVPPPAPQSQQQDTSAAPVSETPIPTPAPDPQAQQTQQPPVQSSPEQPAWQPTEQEKIRMSGQLHSILNDFNQKSKARLEQTRRMGMPTSAEGRRELEAGKFSAELAGQPTQVMGLSRPVQVESGKSDGSDKSDMSDESAVQSMQSPVPYGVKIVDGKRVTEWMLPDGSLTTDLGEADRAEYMAGQARVQHEFERRMKKNGLDPAKPEDVQKQAQLDYEAPMRKVLDSVWAQAEAEDKAVDEDYRREMEEYNKSIRSNIGALGPDGMPLPTPEENLRDYDRAVKRKETFNLESMANTIFRNLPSSYRQQSLNAYQQYFTAHTNELKGRTVEQAAEDALRSEVYNAVYQRAVESKMSKSKTEFFLRKLADQPLLSQYKAMDMAAASMTNLWGMNAAEIDAMSQYGKEHRALDITGTILNMAVDPTTYISGSVGSAAGKQALKFAGKQMIKGASKEVAERFAARTLTGRILAGAAGGAVNFATFESLKNIQGQMAVGGVVNPETGEREFSFDEVLKAGGHGLVLGGVTGTFSPVIGNVADKYVKATSNTAGKMGIRAGELATSTLAEGTVFSAYDIYENSRLSDDDPNKRSNWDIWSDSMAMMLGFKVSHMVKSAPQYVASLRPIKPTNGRPLTLEERNHNRVNFEERLRKRMDVSPRDLDFTKEEREELHRAGYGELADLFTRKEKPTSEVIPEDGAIDFPIADAEEVGRRKEFDGYEEMERLMEDSKVSQAARAKAYFILTGRSLPMSTVTGYTTTRGEDGSVIINSTTADGEIVTSRKFANEKSAQQEVDNIMRQAELNSVDVGERYAESNADDMVLGAAVNEVSPGDDPETVKRIYRAVKAGNKDMTEEQVQLAEYIDDAIARNKDVADAYRPESIREAIKEESGIDIDATLRKSPAKRTEAEQEAVKTYLERLFPEETRKRAEEPTPEQTEAQNQYEQGRELYGRYEEADPTAQADIDAIAMRMQEAYQGVEDAFGAEAEYYMFHLNENPWGLLNDPELTVEQQDAVLYYINSKAALDGVMDASNEVADRKRNEVQQAVEQRTHKDNGVIIPATMKVDDRQVYVVKGDVVMFADGSGVDTRNSSESVIVMDAQSGEYEFASPEQILKVSDVVEPREELESALAVIEQEQMSAFGFDLSVESDGADRSDLSDGSDLGTQDGSESLQNGEKDVTLQHGNGPEQDNDALSAGDDGGRMAADPAGVVAGDRDRSDIRVYEEGLASGNNAHSEYSERDRREAESERLVSLAKQSGQYLDRNEILSRGTRYSKGTGESEVTIDQENGRVYKVKNPYAKSPMKGNVQPEDAIYEHLVHNKYFPETRYKFEGISEDMGDARIVLSQGYVESVGQATKEQIESALAERGLLPEGQYRYGNEEISVTDVTGDNALLGADGKVYFIDPIIDFKKPVREILGDTSEQSEASKPSDGFLSRIPRDEKGEPLFESVDPETAWDGLVEAVGAEADAVDIAMAQVQQATTDLEALKKKTPTPKAPKLKGSPMAMAQAKREAAEKYQSDLAEYNQQVADTQARLDAWNGIVGVYTSRNAELRRQQEEARRQRDAEAHDAAVAQFEEQQRIKAEKQAEQERVGVHTVNPKIRERWEAAPKVEGNEDALTLPDGSTITGRYILTEAGAASPSHDANNAYEPTEGFPIDENGQSVNDRDYLRDKDAQRIVEDIAGSYDNRALQDPVIVSKDGVVLSGNNRTMSGDLAARQGTDKAYNDYLAQFGHKKYGFTPEQVQSMSNPRVVFVPDEALPYDATTFARFNAQEKKSQGKPEAAVKLGKIVPDNIFNNIVSDISRYDRLSDYYADEKAVAQALGALMQAGVINDKQMPELRTGTALSAGGKELLENTLIGKVFQASPDAVRQIISVPTLRQSIVMGLSEIANNRTLSRNGYDLADELANAVDLVQRAKSSNPDIYMEGMPVSPFGRIAGLFDDEFGDSRVTDATTLLLADILNSGKPSDLRKVLAVYNDEASRSAGGQMDMFTGSVATKEDILNLVNEQFRNGTAKEKQRLVDAAIAGRKERATGLQERGGSEAVEQTPSAGAGGEEGAGGVRNPGDARRDSQRAGDLAKAEEDLTYLLSDEVDENGRQFVLTSNGGLEFGSINDIKGLESAPILLSEGLITNNATKDGYGLVHIEARHGEQIRGLGYKSVLEFIETVANNYNTIRKGIKRDGKQTYMLQLTDSHNNTLMVELANDGSYYTINTAGAFKMSYGRNREIVYDRHTTTKHPAEAAEESPESEQSGTHDSAGMNSSTQVSDGKVTKKSGDVQGDSLNSFGEVSKGIYTITPTKYEGKHKTSDVWLVKFNRELTAEEKAALDTFIRGQLTEGKKTSRGWYDRKQEGYMMRSEEAARQLGEMLGNEEAVADAQPMTAQELREAVAPVPSTEKPAKQERKPKKAPINRVSLDDVMTDLSTKGETKLSDHTEPIKAEPEVQHEISDDEMQSLANELRDLLGIGEDEGDAGIKFRDPGELTPQERQRIQSAGIRLAMGLVERGTTSFPDYATKMVGLLGDKIRPWLKSFYEGARWTPGYENIAFTPSEEVARFDVQNFDKEQTNPIAQAAMIVEERKASTASAQAQKELTEIRNNKRKKQDEQTSADTAALTSKAEAVARKAESLAENSEDTAELNRAGEEIDQTIEEINDQLALLGYYEAVEDDAKFHESYGYMLTAEKKAVADATKLAKQLVNDLGIDLKVTSATTPLGRKSVKKGTAVRANIAPAGGDVIINLPLNEGRQLAIYIGLEPVAEKGTRRRGDNLAVERIMYRVENPNGKGYDRYGSNNWANNDVTYAEFLRRIKYVARGFLPEEKAVPSKSETTEEAYHGTVTLKDGREAVVVVANHVQNIGEPSRVTDYIVGVKGEPGTIKISPDEIAHAGAPTHEDKPTIPAKSGQSFPDVKDTEAVSKWLDENSEAIWKGVDAIMVDARQDENLLNTYRADNPADVRELVIGEYIDKWIAERVVEMMNEHPATVKAWFDYGQRGLIADVVDERMAKVVADEAAKAKAEETHNGYRRGDEVMWDRNGNGKWEKQVIKDFDEYGNPILDSFGTNWISEVGDWERIKPADGIFGEAKRVATQSQADRKKSQTPATSTPENPTEKIVEVMTGGKKPAKKKTAVKPEQPVADLFGGLFDEPISDEKKTDVQPRPGTAERERGHEPQPNEPLGESQRNEVKPTDGGGMVGRDNNNPQSNTTRGAGVSEQPKKQVEPLPEAERKNVRNNHAERGVDYAPKGEDARIKANIEAIELAKRLLDAGETATPEQMEILRKFSGWGGLGKAFNDNGYNPTTKRLRDLLGEDGYNEAVMSRNSAYFTPAPVIDAMWDVARALGFKGGNVLEGSAGIGNILGLMPTDISDRSNIHAVEIDRTTGGILSLLYPDAKVDIQGFERTKVRNNSVDLAITNVPFVTGLHVKDDTGDKDLSKKFRNIHDFCIAKNIRKLREGGLGIFITSSGTMDNSKELRRWITNEGNADVIGAFRMHNKTFGGTGATSDIIVVRKRVNGKPSPNAIDVADVTGVRVVDYDTGETRKVKGQEIPIIKPYSMTYNKYFAEHPENMAGEMLFNFERGETRFPTSRALFPSADKPQERMLSEWAARFADMKEEAPSTSVEEEVTRINEKLGEGVKEGSMVLNSQGELCMARMGEAVPIGLNKNKVKGHTKAECFEDYTAIKKALSDVLEYQSTNEDNAGLEPLLKELNRAFDTFTMKYGNLHKNPAISFLRNDVDFSSIMALETYSERGDKKGNKVVKVGKTDIFSRRVIETEKEPQPTTIKDGILASLYKSGGIDVDYISQSLDKSAEEVKQEIVKSGLGYENPSTGAMEVSYQYLSGNVRAKLHIAQENNEDGRYDANIAALEKVIPMTIPAHLIEFALGSSWIEPKLYEDFVYDKTGIRVKLTNVGGTWFMKTPWSTFNEKNRAMAVTSKMCDKTIMGHELIEAAITNRQITVSKQVKHYDGTTETISDKAATAECSTKIDEIRSEFKDWARGRMQTDPEMSARIEQTYNEQFNNYVPMSIPDEFVPQHFGGQVTELHGKPFALRPHQGRAVVRGTTEPILLAHEVGTGKTYTLITTAMEMRRLGTARKPMIVVQNATVGQFVESAKEIYPNAKVLTIEEADRTAEGRKNFYAKIKYNDWDMIVVPQSVFERIPDSPEREIAYTQDIIEEKMKVLEAMREAGDDGRSMIVRQAEKELEEKRDLLAQLTEAIEGKKKKRDEKKEATTRQNAEVRAMEMLDRDVDDVENFDDMGIDAILVDEAHEYKHLGFATAMQRGVKGVDPSFSKKSQGVYLKTQAVMERNHGRNVVFATGTPISNTAAEIWTFMRYLMPADQMKAYDIFYFDDFVRNFGNLAQMVEFKTNGKFAEVSRFAGYVNLPELVRIWSGVADTVLTREAGGVSDKIPEMEGGKPTDIYLPQTRALRSVMKYVKAELDRYDKMTGKEKKENSHIPLTMYGIAKAAAVDARLVIPNAEDDPNSKTNATVRETLRSLKESATYKGTVAIFSDNYQNKRSGFNLYEEIRNKLIAEGIPAEQIVVIKSGMTVKKKLDIFDKVNAGEIRVILGSTFTLGTGVNIQERLHTLIHVDAPNRPMDYTQRNGRAMRQGNLHKDMGIPVRIIRFGVEDSLDVTAYQRLKTKGAIADSIMNGSKMMQNSMENRVLEEEEDTFGDMTAQLSGSEYAILKNQAEREVRNLTAKQKGHDIDQIYVHNQLPKVEGFIKGAERRIEIETKNLETIGKHWPDGALKKITIGKLSFDSVEGMEDFFKDQNAKMNEAAEKIREGADNWTSRLTIDVDGLPFEVTTTVTREVDNSGQGTLSFEPERKVTYSCEALGIKDRTVKGNRIKNVMQEIAERIVPGIESRELLSRGQNQLAHYSEDYRQLQERNGREFPFKQQLAEAKERLAQYEELMMKELEEKEAKYAEMDKAVDAATDITLDDDGEDTPTSGDGNKYRLVEQKELLDFLDGQPLKKGYRYSQWANMGVLPPMTAKQNGEWRAPMIFSRWEQSEEGMRKDNGKADLVQGNGRTTGDVAYNPYFHIRTSPLNDQFTAAYDRPELLVVEGYYPESEEESGYRAEGAKDAVGLMDWHSGSVNGQLSEDTKVQTMLSRYFKPSRIVPWSEVADLIMERVGDQRITFPINAVPPMLRAELAKRGAKFGDISGSVADADIPMLNDLRDRVNAGEWDAGLERAREYMDAYESSSEAKEARVEKLSADLHTPIRVISDQSEIDALPTRRERRAKGWWSSDDNGVVVVLPNNVNVADVDNTVVHEVVGHKGLRALIGAERFDDFLGEVYNHASNPIRKTIDKMTDDMVNAEADRLRVRKSIAHERAGEDVNTNYYTDMAEARLEAEQKREQFRKEATEEYMSDLGGRIGSEGFEKMSRDELTLWGKIKAKVQQFLDKFLQGLKIAKSIRLNDKDLSYILYKSWKNLRKKGMFADAEDAVRRRQSGYDADDVTRFRDPGLGLEETITRMKTEAMQANAGNLQAKRDAMRAIGGNLNHLRQAMARQREYDITTVKSVSDLARVLMEAGLLDDLSKYETKRILGAINNVVGKQDVSQYVQKVMDIMVDNQLRLGANTLGRLLSIRGSRVDARGIEVQGELDPEGQRIAQVVRKSTSLPKDDIDNRIADALNRMGSADNAIADEATIEYAGLQIARQYVEDITESKAEEKELRDSIKQAKEDKDAGQMTEAAYKQYVEAINDAIRQNKIDRAEAFHSLVEQVGDVMSGSIERAKAWREAEKQRVEEIHHNANSDMEGRPTDEHHKDDRTQKIVNNSFARFLLAPLATFDQMLRMFGKKNTRGEGYLWNRYMRGWVEASEKEYTGYREALKVLDDKVSEVFGKKMSWGDLFSIDRKLPKASVSFWDGGEMKDHELTQGNLLYIYMADKMSDGRMKLRRMGVTEEDITHIKNFLDPRFIELADWMQDEFLVDKRNEYNEVHKRMFGASMAAIENYFPLKILANARLENVDVADDTTDNVLPATSTGSIIKRRRNNLALDVTGANAFSVILDHLQQMERWAAFAEFNRDLNTLLSYKRFRNQVMNMSSVYGAGKTLWNNFRNVCSMAAGAYRPPIAALDKSAVNIAKGVTAAKVSFRLFTALKQFLSMPAYLSDSNPAYLIANIANPIGAWKWSMENLPLFEKRWKSRMAGDPRLLKTDMDWKMWRSRVVEIASRVGMSPNAFVDALTVAIGTHAMYQTKLAKYKRQGYDPDVAEARAKQDATILFNQTQQSSEGAFLSTMQVDRSWLSVLFTVFRNSSMSYTRQLYDAMRNIGHRLTPGYKGMSEEFMSKQMRRDGIDPDQADRNAKREYRRGIIRDLVKIGVFGYILQFAWNLGAYLPYLIFGDNEDEKDNMMDDVFNHSMFGSIEGLTGGDVMSAAGNMWLSGEGNPAYLTKDMPLASDVLSILKKMDKDQVSAMNDVINLCVQSGLGVNPQSLTDAVTAVMDFCGDDAETSRECALLMTRVFNCPQSQIDKIYFDELDASARDASKMTPSEIAERYARYKVRRGAPLTGWAYGSEQREKLMDKYRERSNTLAKERLSRETENAVSLNMAEWLNEFRQTKDRVSEINKVKSKDEDRYYEMLDELEATPEFDRYLIIKDYKREVDALTKEWLKATTPAERDSCAQAIVSLKREMVSQLQQAQ
ncbi:MAG: hypothetical protein HDR86_03645 [Bacteroides sp.]|nr:hypothetical protein [Bacteroides sp.]